ncbi:MAG TPA: AGE family epimerase/isomerase [bacterium]|nr:AGE family epimerase/isomerase [bacterium]
MKRRKFLGVTLGSATSLATVSCRSASETCSKRNAAEQLAVPDGCRLAGRTLPELRDEYRFWLFDDFLPFMDRHVIDHEFGGFLCTTDRRGVNLSDSKSSWYEGRGIWVYSFLYQHLAREEKNLEAARKSVELILKSKPKDPEGTWSKELDRQGNPVSPPSVQVYGDLFIAEGLAEYSRASGKPEYWDRAKEIVLKCVRIYDRPDYNAEIGKTYLGPDARSFPGARILGVWMVLIRVSTQMLRIRQDRDLENLAARCVNAIMNHHFNPEFDLLNELINHDLSRPDNEYAQLVYTGHALETLWMVMDEALRLRDRALFERTGDRFLRHFQVAWDDVYGGVFRDLQHVDNNTWLVDKVLWAQEEVLIGALMMVEHLGSEQGREVFSKMYAYVIENYPLRKHGYALWDSAGDRKMTFVEAGSRAEHYHHPRHLMLNLLSLDRIIEREGKMSGLI